MSVTTFTLSRYYRAMRFLAGKLILYILLQVVSGEATVYRIEQVKTDNHNNPVVPIVIYSCGVLPMLKSYIISDKNYDYE